MLHDHLVKNRARLDYKKNLIFSSGHVGIFQKGVAHDYGPKVKNYSLVSFLMKHS